MRSSLVIACALLAACQPLPKPFSNDGGPPSDLLQLSDAQGITVLPVIDRDGEPLEKLTTQMVAALHRQNIPASYSSGSQSSYLLLGYFTMPPTAPKLIWTLKDPQGVDIGSVVQPLDNGAPDKFGQRQAMERSATVLASMIQDEAPAESVPPALHVGAVAGAPGDGNSRLRAAIEQVLPRAGLELTPRADADSLTVTGKVRIEPERGGEQMVEIAWTVTDPYGVEVGTIAQARPVAAGSLEKSWGLLANEAALAGATGIAEMLRQIDWTEGIPQPPG